MTARDTGGSDRIFRAVVVCGGLSWFAWLVLMRMSARFAWGTVTTERPLLATLGILGLLFVFYAAASSVVLRSVMERRTLAAVIVFSVAFRLLMLFSEPIQEIDAYRYIWDGKVVAAGVNPFRFSPQQVRDAETDGPLAADLKCLVDVRDRSAANARILSRIHYGELTTVYPPTSQAVFGAVAALTPHDWSVSSQLLMMKAAMVLFDLATLAAVIGLLRFVGRPPEWSILYGWCPLIVKEFANSGHLDAIAVFLTAALVLCALRAFFPGRGRAANVGWLWLCSLLVAAAVGAKIYPVVLFPLLFFGAWRVFGLTRAVSVATVTLGLCILMIVPMLTREESGVASVARRDSDTGPLDVAEPPRPSLEGDRAGNEKFTAPIEVETPTGLAAFASQWQMNDFLFLLLYENLRPNPLREEPPVHGVGESAESDSEFPPRPPSDDELTNRSSEARIKNVRPTVWFVMTSNDWRRRIAERAGVWLGVESARVPFLMTRMVTSLVFVGLALWLVVRCGRQWDAELWLEAAFLTLAWFWMLQPTQNPWYWTWAMPFVPFVRSRVWIAVSGVVLIYYLRFWLTYHLPDTPVAGTPYSGREFYDFCVVWMEYLPFLCSLALGSRRR